MSASHRDSQREEARHHIRRTLGPSQRGSELQGGHPSDEQPERSPPGGAMLHEMGVRPPCPRAANIFLAIIDNCP